jgi:hypothetical protein
LGRGNRNLGGDRRRRFGESRRCERDLPQRGARHEERRSLSALARRDRGAINLRLNQNVVRAADHDKMFNIVAPDKHQLPLTVEAECIDQPEPRLAGPSTRNAQAMCKRQPINKRKHDERGDAAS